MLGRLAGWGFTTVPVLVIGALGADYVRRVIHAVPDYREPFAMRVPAGQRELDVRVWNLRVDPFGRKLWASRLEARKPSGQLLAATTELSVSQNSRGVIEGRVQKLWGRIDRMKDGSFDLETYLKGPKQAPQDQPFEFDIGRADLVYADHGAAWTQPVRLVQTYVAGNRDRVTGRTRGNLAGLGRVNGSFQSGEKEGVSAWGTLDLELAPLLGPLRKMRETRTLRELKRLSVRSLRARGPFTVATQGNAFGFASRVTGRGAQVQFDQYRATNATFAGDLTDRGFRGNIAAADAGLNGKFQGEIAFGLKPRVKGNVEAAAGSTRQLPAWLARAIPRDVSSDAARAKGWVDWDGARLRTMANVTVARGSFGGQPVENLQGVVTSDGRNTTLQVQKGAWRGTPVSGAIALEGPRLRGFFEAKTVDFGRLGPQFGVRDLSGNGRLVGVLGGTASQPMVDFSMQGRVKSTLTGRRLDLGLVHARGTFAKNAVTIQQFLVDGPQGRVSGTGRYGLADQNYAFDVRGTGLNLASFASDLKGSGAYAGQIRGRGKKFSTSGKLEAFDVETAGQRLDYVASDLVADLESARANNFTVLSRGTQAKGWASFNFKNQGLGGEFEALGIRLENFVAKDQPLAGFARIRSGKLGGTLSKPQIDAELSGDSLVAWNVRFDRLETKIRLRGEQITARDLVLTAPEGTIAGSVAASTSSRTGTFALNAKGVQVASVFPDLAATASVSGTVTGELTGTFSSEGLLSAEGKGDVDQVFVNRTFMGSGPVSFRKVGDNYEGSALVGQIGQFIDLPNFSYNIKHRNLNATFTASKVPIEQLFAISRRWVEPDARGETFIKLPESVLSQFRTLKGRLSVDGTAGGPVDNLVLENVKVELDELEQNEASLGNLQALFNRTDRIWTLDQLNWKARSPQDSKEIVPTLSAKGTFDEKGQTTIEGSLTALEASWFAWLNPDLANVPGTISSELFRISGDAQKPLVQASLNYTAAPTEGKPAERQVDLLAELSEGQISAEGSYYLAGFTGAVRASMPFSYAKGIDSDAPIQGTAKLEARKLADLTEFFPWLDAEKSRGKIGGTLTLAGSLRKPDFSGEASLVAVGDTPNVIAARKDAMGGSQVPWLNQVSAKLTLDQGRLSLNGTAESSEGGRLLIQDLGAKLDGIESFVAGDLDRLFENPVFGTARFESFGVSYRDRSGPTKSFLSGNITLSDLLARPKIAGRLQARSTEVSIPELPAGSGETPIYAVNPQFDIRVDMVDPVNLKSGTGSFTILGFGEVTGSLSNPNLLSELDVQGGFLRLPNARIALDRDGAIRITYQNGLAVADMNLTGRTAVTAQGLNGVPERYDVLLGIRGNLFQADGLVLTASADPPDLSQDRILALLGQRELIAGIASETNAGAQIQSALFGVAVPYVAGALTDSLAQSLGLDFLNVDYNSFDQVSVSAGINLGKNFSVFGRRQLSRPLPGLSQKFEIKLSYRPTFLQSNFARRLRISIGLDQDRPRKIVLEYGFRF